MMGIQSTGMQNISQMREMMQNMQSFKSGETTLSKENLTSIQSTMQSKGIKAADGIQSMIDDFDKIDLNGDGISSDEAQNYGQSMGISFGPGEPPPGMFGKMGGQGGHHHGAGTEKKQEEEQSYIDKLLESLYSPDPNDDIETFSLSV